MSHLKLLTAGWRSWNNQWERCVSSNSRAGYLPSCDKWLWRHWSFCLAEVNNSSVISECDRRDALWSKEWNSRRDCCHRIAASQSYTNNGGGGGKKKVLGARCSAHKSFCNYALYAKNLAYWQMKQSGEAVACGEVQLKGTASMWLLH